MTARAIISYIRDWGRPPQPDPDVVLHEELAGITAVLHDGREALTQYVMKAEVRVLQHEAAIAASTALRNAHIEAAEGARTLVHNLRVLMTEKL